MAVSASNSEASAAEVRAIVADLLVEKNQYLKAHNTAAAEAIGLAIDYWQKVLAKITRTDGEHTPLP